MRDRLQLFNEEIAVLNEEIRELKKCQINYFSLSITITGVILGFHNAFNGLVFFAPLAIVLPCWLIFFDKAHTITRIVGYIKLLEKNIGGFRRDYYLGFENALSLYRRHERKIWNAFKKNAALWERFEKQRPRKRDVLLLRTRYRFWILNWLTFCGLSLVCVLGYYFNRPGITWRYWLACLPLLLCVGYTVWMICLLVWGRCSYDGCTEIWKRVLEKYNSRLRQIGACGHIHKIRTAQMSGHTTASIMPHCENCWDGVRGGQSACKIRQCVLTKDFLSCAECGGFPCDVYCTEFKHDSEEAWNISRIKESGIEQLLKEIDGK
jgi:hypothetical protein